MHKSEWNENWVSWNDALYEFTDESVFYAREYVLWLRKMASNLLNFHSTDENRLLIECNWILLSSSLGQSTVKIPKIYP